MKDEIYKLNQNFAKNLKLERKSRQLTQRQVAEMIGIKTQSYQAYENNITMPNVENLLKMAIIFGLSIDELFELK